jgi:hypothetical protein
MSNKILASLMALFTIIAEYRGGTYVGQHNAAAPKEALQTWAQQFPNIRGSFIGSKLRAKLCAAVCNPDNELVPITGTENVWFWSSIDLPSYFAVHLVWTKPVRRVAKPSRR